MDRRRHVDQRLSALKSERSYYIDEWRDCCDLVLGARGRWLLSTGQKLSSRRYDLLYNEEAKYAANTLASGMMAGITSPARPWFKLETPDPDMMDYGPVKEWLEKVQQIMFAIFRKSNFYNAAHTMYKEMGVFGNAPMGIYQDFNNIIRCENYTIGSYYLAANGQRQVDTFYREYRPTVIQMIDKFGLKNVSRAVRQQYEKGNYDTTVEVIHAIEPNKWRQFNSPLAKDMKFSSMYFEKAEDRDSALSISGFEEDPIMSPRWEVLGEDVYSTFYPGIDCMGTNKSLQVEELDKAVAIEKMHNPAMVADASINQDGIDLVAGGVTFVPNMSAMGKPGLQSAYDINFRIGDLKEDIAMKENRIQRAFYADLFLMVTEMDRAQITATEIAERKEEKMLMLGPVLERLNDEFLDPTIDRTFNLAQKAGILPPAPEELRDVDLKVEYISVLAQAQKAISTASMESTAAFAANLAALSPEAVDKINVDEMIDEHARAKGSPAKSIRTEDEVAEIREARAQQMAGLQAQEQAAAASQTAKTLSETETGEGNALSDLMGYTG